MRHTRRYSVGFCGVIDRATGCDGEGTTNADEEPEPFGAKHLAVLTARPNRSRHSLI
jgi:hypothetical protein